MATLNLPKSFFPRLSSVLVCSATLLLALRHRCAYRRVGQGKNEMLNQTQSGRAKSAPIYREVVCTSFAVPVGAQHVSRDASAAGPGALRPAVHGCNARRLVREPIRSIGYSLPAISRFVLNVGTFVRTATGRLRRKTRRRSPRWPHSSRSEIRLWRRSRAARCRETALRWAVPFVCVHRKSVRS